MKKVIYLLVATMMLSAIFTSCKKEEENNGNGNENGGGNGNGTEDVYLLVEKGVNDYVEKYEYDDQNRLTKCITFNPTCHFFPIKRLQNAQNRLCGKIYITDI